MIDITNPIIETQPNFGIPSNGGDTQREHFLEIQPSQFLDVPIAVNEQKQLLASFKNRVESLQRLKENPSLGDDRVVDQEPANAVVKTNGLKLQEQDVPKNSIIKTGKPKIEDRNNKSREDKIVFSHIENGSTTQVSQFLTGKNESLN